MKEFNTGMHVHMAAYCNSTPNTDSKVLIIEKKAQSLSKSLKSLNILIKIHLMNL